MHPQLIEPTLELTVKLTRPEADCLRTAMSKSSTAEERKEAAELLFKSLRDRESRFTLRELGK
jgi:hypothetical protein